MSKKPKTKKPKIKANQNKAKQIETRPPQLNYRTALQYLDNIVALAPVSRQGHIQAQQALQQLSGALTELEQLKKPKE